MILWIITQIHLSIGFGGVFAVYLSRGGLGVAASWREQLSFNVDRKLPKKAA